jgi:hypothetical protein
MPITRLLSLHCILEDHPFQSLDLLIQTLNPYLESQGSWHISLITKIIRNLKCWTNPFQLYALLDLVCLGPVCLWLWTSIAIDWKERTCLVERSERVWTPKRQVTHISSTYFYYCISVFSSMHDRWNIQVFYKMLRS